MTYTKVHILFGRGKSFTSLAKIIFPGLLGLPLLLLRSPIDYDFIKSCVSLVTESEFRVYSK